MDMKKLMKQMQKAQSAQAEVQEKLGAMTVTGSAGGGLISVTASGQGAITAIKLEKSVVDPDDLEALEDLILVAVQDAQKKAGDLQQAEFSKVLGGLGALGGM